MITAVLVDDEPPARRKLRHLLASEADISVVGEAGSGAEAVELLNRVQPDLAFLDIELPDCTGFDIVESLSSHDKMHLVFVTAHDHFALKAFDVHAIDYLLKPVEPSRFRQSLKRIRGILATSEVNRVASRLDALTAELRSQPAYRSRLLIPEGDRSIFLEV